MRLTLYENIVYTFNEVFNHSFIYFALKNIIIPLLIVMVLTTVFYLLFDRYSSDKFDNQKIQHDEEIDSFLVELIFNDNSLEELKSKIHYFKENVLKNNKKLEIYLLDKLLHIRETITYLNENRIIHIYKYFSFNTYSNNLMHKRSWYNKSLGFYHYQTLNYKIKKGQITPYLKSKNEFLRSNAVIALISLSDENFSVLDNYPFLISKVDELKILDIIYQRRANVPENIDKWLLSKNESIVIIAIKLIVRYRYEYIFKEDQIQYLLKHENPSIRKEIIQAIRELITIDARNILKQHYEIEPNKRIKISLLKTLGVIGDEDTIKFAISIINNETDLDIIITAVYCIHHLEPNFFKKVNQLLFTNYEQVHKMFLHVKNPYLKVE